MGVLFAERREFGAEEKGFFDRRGIGKSEGSISDTWRGLTG